MDTVVTVALGVYAGIGVLVALGFILVGGPRKVPGFRGSGILFRAWILPSGVILWPLLAAVWILRPTLTPPEAP